MILYGCLHDREGFRGGDVSGAFFFALSSFSDLFYAVQFAYTANSEHAVEITSFEGERGLPSPAFV